MYRGVERGRQGQRVPRVWFSFQLYDFPCSVWKPLLF